MATYILFFSKQQQINCLMIWKVETFFCRKWVPFCCARSSIINLRYVISSKDCHKLITQMSYGFLIMQIATEMACAGLWRCTIISIKRVNGF